MGRIDLKKWFIGDNTLSISLVDFWVDVDIKNSGSNIYVELKLIDSDMQTNKFNFVSLEEAIDFTENVINKYRNTQKIVTIYNEKYKQEVESLFGNKTDKMVLTPEEVEHIIMDYYGFNNGFRMSVVKKVEANRGKIDVIYYLVEPMAYSGMKINKIRLSEKDLTRAINDYIKIYDSVVVDYEYIGEISKPNDKANVRYDGMELTIKEKEKKLILN